MRTGFKLAMAVISAGLVVGGCKCQPAVTTGSDSGVDSGQPSSDAGGGGDAGIPPGTPSQHVIPGFCPGCPAFPGTPNDGGLPGFGNLGDAGACTGTGVNPTLVYPNDGSLYPPNTNVIEIQFLPGAGNQYFEIDFENAITDVRVETQCTPITNAVGTATGGCGFTLDATTWSYIASNNAGLDPLTVTVRGTPDLSCVAGSNSRTMLFAAEPVQGAIYYWQSVVFGTLQGTSGGIYRYDFGGQAAAPSPFLVPSSTSAFGNRCLGCHFISRDGQKMTFGNDDTDADDEYSDLSTAGLDVGSYASDGGGLLKVTLSPGFQTFSPDHSVFLASDGLNRNNPAAFYLYSGNTGTAATPPTVASGARATQPDWSADGTQVVFVEPAKILPSGGKGTCSCQDAGAPAGTCPAGQPYVCTCTPPTTGNLYDNHFVGGSLFTMSANGANTFGTPTPLLASSGENNFYPAWAPDNAYILFNRVITDAGSPDAGGAADDAFSNPLAGVWAIPASGGTPVELTTLESGGVTNDAAHPFPSGGLTNSWPRFSPFVQTYKGKKLYWLTFSSTRDYGVRVQNQVTGEVNCYPPETIENSCSGKTQLTQPNCAQPQIWMAAVTEDGLANGDTSFPAFWLPFQSLAAHNHIAQWATTFVGPPGCLEGCPDGGPRPDAGSGGDGGVCAAYNQSCNPDGGMTACCTGLTCTPPSDTCQISIQ